MILISLDRYDELTKKSKQVKRENDCVDLSEEDILSFVPDGSIHKA